MTPDFIRALEMMENTSDHIFITGRAGTGKSTLLNLFRESTKKNVAILAPTGVAAVNVKGQTIHSFFGFKPDITFDKVKRVKDANDLYTRLETLVIDEISMVRADLLDCVDKFLRINGPHRDRAFGGVQIIFIGDLYQLPPVVTSMERPVFEANYATPYFFSSSAFGGGQNSLFEQEVKLEFIELQEMFRQSDKDFIEILNAVRDNTVSAQHLALLNSRVGVFASAQKKQGDLEMYLTTTNAEASAINEKELSALRGEEFCFSAQFEGEFDHKAIPTEKDLAVKIGAQIMMLNNDSQGRWMNGTVGRVKAVQFSDEVKEYAVVAELSDGETVEIFPHKWDMYHFHFNEETKRIDSEAIGSYTQYPFRLAWAVTIHKAQGKTFDRVVLDIGRGTFSPGQLYVALSRCRTLEGISLRRPIERRHVFLDRRVSSFLKEFYRK